MEIQIKPEVKRSRVLAAIHEIWLYRELALVLIDRDIRVRYKQTFVGITWAFVQPFMTMVVFTLFFGKLAKIPTGDIPYHLFSFAGILPWQYFARSMTEGSGTLLTNSGILTKVYFPREVLPISTVVAGLVDFMIGMVFMIILMIVEGYYPSLRILWCIPLIGLSALLALSFSFWVSSAAAIYRDIGFIIPFLVQMLMFATPVIYPANMVPEAYQFIYNLNPMVLVIEGFRWALLGMGDAPSLMQVSTSVGVVIILLLTGLSYFNNAVRQVADKI
jgi:lipopolysaccharide transport system permease protein